MVRAATNSAEFLTIGTIGYQLHPMSFAMRESAEYNAAPVRTSTRFTSDPDRAALNAGP
jgi:hypothetical protein